MGCMAMKVGFGSSEDVARSLSLESENVDVGNEEGALKTGICGPDVFALPEF